MPSPFVKGFINYRWITLTKGKLYGTRSHTMTISCQWCCGVSLRRCHRGRGRVVPTNFKDINGLPASQPLSHLICLRAVAQYRAEHCHQCDEVIVACHLFGTRKIPKTWYCPADSCVSAVMWCCCNIYTSGCPVHQATTLLVSSRLIRFTFRFVRLVFWLLSSIVYNNMGLA